MNFLMQFGTPLIEQFGVRLIALFMNQRGREGKMCMEPVRCLVRDSANNSAYQSIRRAVHVSVHVSVSESLNDIISFSVRSAVRSTIRDSVWSVV